MISPHFFQCHFKSIHAMKAKYEAQIQESPSTCLDWNFGSLINHVTVRGSVCPLVGHAFVRRSRRCRSDLKPCCSSSRTFPNSSLRLRRFLKKSVTMRRVFVSSELQGNLSRVRVGSSADLGG